MSKNKQKSNAQKPTNKPAVVTVVPVEVEELVEVVEVQEAKPMDEVTKLVTTQHQVSLHPMVPLPGDEPKQKVELEVNVEAAESATVSSEWRGAQPVALHSQEKVAEGILMQQAKGLPECQLTPDQCRVNWFKVLKRENFYVFPIEKFKTMQLDKSCQLFVFDKHDEALAFCMKHREQLKGYTVASGHDFTNKWAHPVMQMRHILTL